jgi:uncharacterized membrane protein
MNSRSACGFAAATTTQRFKPRWLWQLRVLLLLLSAGWLMAPLSALLADMLFPALNRTDAVIVASFVGPLLSLVLVLLGMWPRRLRIVVVGLALLHAIAGYWALGVLS